MKNNIKDYIGLSDEDKKFLREFDKAVERGMFDDKKIKIPKKIKKQISKERQSFRNDLMHQGRRSASDVDGIVVEKKYVGNKKVKTTRDKSGKFTKKGNDENTRDK